MEKHKKKFEAADKRLLGNLMVDNPSALGPAGMTPPKDLRQSPQDWAHPPADAVPVNRADQIEADVGRIIAYANELKGEFAIQVMERIANANSPMCEFIGPSVKGKRRSIEKTRADYGGDAMRLKDALRCSIYCGDSMGSLIACWMVVMALVEEGTIVVLQIKNRFRDGATSGGYRDLNLSVAFRGLICEVQLHAGPYLMLKEAAHPAYELCRSLKLLDEAGTLGHNEAEPEIPFRTQLIVGLLLRVPAAYAGLTMGLAYIFRGLIQLVIILIHWHVFMTGGTRHKGGDGPARGSQHPLGL